MDHVTLYYREGSSDKVYQVAIEPSADKFVVNFAFGRRGTTLNTGSKTQPPVDYEQATRIFAKLVESKKAKGYTVSADGTPYEHTEKAGQVSGVHCQLLNAIDEEEASRSVAEPTWCMQEKKDGRRLLIRSEGGIITGINRKGLVVGLPEPLIKDAQTLPGDFILDGECVGETFFAFDVLVLWSGDITEKPYCRRLAFLTDFLQTKDLHHIQLIETAVEPQDKATMLLRLRQQNNEGVVFKDLFAPYTSGRPASGGAQVKLKFYATGSFIVAGINDKRSVSLRLIDSDTACGNVTIPQNHPVPKVGAVVEVRYLYAFKESGCLYQPVYLQRRDDLDPGDCTSSQLKFKAGDTEEDEA